MSLKLGDIVIANIPDPSGQPIDHPHPAMVLRAVGNVAYLVGISTSYPKPPPLHWLELPLDALTNLRKPCVLKCDWITKPIDTSRCQKIGEVPTEILERATDWIVTLIERKKGC